MLFDSRYDQQLREGPRATEYEALQARFSAASDARREAARAFSREQSADQRGGVARDTLVARDSEVRAVRTEALMFVRDATGWHVASILPIANTQLK